MNEGIKKFEELLITDTEVQEKIRKATQAYTGEQTEEAMFNNILVPIAAEYGISATFDEYMSYIEGLAGQELNENELAQVAGGKVTGGGVVMMRCEIVGFGAGAGGGNGAGGACVGVGFGTGATGCLTVGVSGTYD